MANGSGIVSLGVPSNMPPGGITTVPEMPDAPRRTAGEMLQSLAEDVRPYAGPHLTGGVLNVGKPIAALIDYIRKNPGRSAQFALENSMAGDTKLALESAMQAGRDVGSGQLGPAAYNTATAVGAAAAAALPVVGAKMLGLKTKLPATDEASRSGQGLLDRILSDTGGSESVQPLFSSYDPADQLATMFDLNTLKDADVDFARREIMRMTRDRFADGPEYLTVYRGGPVRGDAVPVTTEKSTAQFHAKLNGSPVVEYKIHRDDVLADIGLLRRNEFAESELLVRPSALVPMDEASRMARAQEMGRTAEGYHGTDADISEFGGPTWITDDPEVGSYYAQRARARTAMSDAADDTGLYDEVMDVDEVNPFDVAEAVDPTGKNVMPLKYDQGKQLDMTSLGDAPAPEELIEFLAERGIIKRPDDIGDWLNELTVDQPTLWKAIEDWGLDRDIKNAGYDSLKIKDIVSAKKGTIGQDSVLVFDPKNIRSRFAQFDPAKAGSADILAGLAGLGVLGAGASAGVAPGTD